MAWQGVEQAVNWMAGDQGYRVWGESGVRHELDISKPGRPAGKWGAFVTGSFSIISLYLPSVYVSCSARFIFEDDPVHFRKM
jgi:hypothetical protein